MLKLLLLFTIHNFFKQKIFFNFNIKHIIRSIPKVFEFVNNNHYLLNL